jgi:exonuclease SbcC
MTLERLQLTNFQAHKKLRIDLDPEFTTIVGPSDVGKTTVLRALRWLCTNRPRGIEYKTWDTDKTVVRASFEGAVLARKRSDDENLYILNGREYRAMGADVPETISNLLNLSDINFLDQLDRPQFWFHDTPTQVAKNLNAVVNLDVIDEVLEELARRARAVKARREVIEERLAAAKKETKRLAPVRHIDQDLQTLEALADRVATRHARHAALAAHITTAREAAVLYEGYSNLAAAAAVVARRGDEAFADRLLATRMAAYLEEYTEKKQEVKELRAIAKAPVAPLEDLGLKALADKIHVETLGKLVDDAWLAMQKRKRAKADLETAQTELDKITKDTICPVCQRPMKS